MLPPESVEEEKQRISSTEGFWSWKNASEPRPPVLILGDEEKFKDDLDKAIHRTESKLSAYAHQRMFMNIEMWPDWWFTVSSWRVE